MQQSDMQNQDETGENTRRAAHTALVEWKLVLLRRLSDRRRDATRPAFRARSTVSAQRHIFLLFIQVRTCIY